MPIRNVVIADLNLFLTRVEGKVDDQIAFQHQESIVKIPGYCPTLNTLMDTRLVTENLLSPEILVKLSTGTPFDNTVKRAYVINSEKAAMLATIFGATSSADEKFFITYKMEDACEWLGVSYDAVMASSIYSGDKQKEADQLSHSH